MATLPVVAALSISWRPHAERRIPFMNLRQVAVSLSVVLLLCGVGIWGTRGLNYGIDFKGGTEIVVKTKSGLERGSLAARLA